MGPCCALADVPYAPCARQHTEVLYSTRLHAHCRAGDRSSRSSTAHSCRLRDDLTPTAAARAGEYVTAPQFAGVHRARTTRLLLSSMAPQSTEVAHAELFLMLIVRSISRTTRTILPCCCGCPGREQCACRPEPYSIRVCWGAKGAYVTSISE